jgi:hypothetical protein
VAALGARLRALPPGSAPEAALPALACTWALLQGAAGGGDAADAASAAELRALGEEAHAACAAALAACAGAPPPPPPPSAAAEALPWVAGGLLAALGSLRAPALSPRPGQWDARIISNVAVAPCGGGNESLLAVYKSSSPAGAGNAQTRVCLGVAFAPRWDAPFQRLSDNPILPCPLDSFYSEDPTLWRAPDGVFHLVFKDFVGNWTHAGYSGAHATSADGGATWVLASPPLAYTTTHAWSDGRVRRQHAQERAQVLLNETDGQPLAMFYATDTELDGSTAKTWNMAVPAR